MHSHGWRRYGFLAVVFVTYVIGKAIEMELVSESTLQWVAGFVLGSDGIQQTAKDWQGGNDER